MQGQSSKGSHRKKPHHMQPIPIGLIGVGKHGSRYLRHLLQDETGFRLAGISRKNQEEGVRAAKHHSLRYFPDWQELIADPDIQAVLIVTHPSLHVPMALEAIKARKAILVEKPLALNGEQGRQILQAAEQAHIPLMTAQTLRYDPTIQRLQQIASQMNDLEYLTSTMRLESSPIQSTEAQPQRVSHEASVGVILELGVHLFDLVRVLTQDEVQSVKADLSQPSPDSPEHRAWIRLTTKKGIEGYLEVARVSKGRITRAELIGREGQTVADWTHGEVRQLFGEDRTVRYSCPPQPTLTALLKDFAQALHHGTRPTITGTDGLRAVEIADACIQADQIGQTVQLPKY